MKKKERNKERKMEGKRENESYSETWQRLEMFPPNVCQTGNSGVRVRFLRLWTKNSINSKLAENGLIMLVN